MVILDDQQKELLADFHAVVDLLVGEEGGLVTDVQCWCPAGEGRVLLILLKPW